MVLFIIMPKLMNKYFSSVPAVLLVQKCIPFVAKFVVFVVTCRRSHNVLSLLLSE